jgi:hypothetical protein
VNISIVVFYIKHGNIIPVLCCYMSCVVICTDWLCNGCVVGDCIRVERMHVVSGRDNELE